MTPDFQSVDSEGQQKLFSKVEQGVLEPEAGLLPSLQEDRGLSNEPLGAQHDLYLPADRPNAVERIVPGENIVVVCAWHRGKAEAHRWGSERGYQITHTICPACAAILNADTQASGRNNQS